MPELEHSSALIRAFIAPERRERYLALLASRRGRDKLRAALARLHDLDRRCCHDLPKGVHSAQEIGALLKAKGAPDECVLLAEDVALDGQCLPLGEALQTVIGRGMGTFISCLPVRLAFYEGEDLGVRYVLEPAI